MKPLLLSSIANTECLFTQSIPPKEGGWEPYIKYIEQSAATNISASNRQTGFTLLS